MMDILSLKTGLFPAGETFCLAGFYKLILAAMPFRSNRFLFKYMD